jgi:hypothetical protein
MLAFGLQVVTVPQLPEGGDYENENCQQTMNLNRSTKPDLTTETPLLGRCCYRFGLHKSHKYEQNI